MNNIEEISLSENGQNIIMIYERDNKKYKKIISIYDQNLQNIFDDYQKQLKEIISSNAIKNPLYHKLNIFSNVCAGASGLLFVIVLLSLFVYYKPPLPLVISVFVSLAGYGMKYIGVDINALKIETEASSNLKSLYETMDNVTKQKEMDLKMKQRQVNTKKNKKNFMKNLQVIEDYFIKAYKKGERFVLQIKSDIEEKNEFRRKTNDIKRRIEIKKGAEKLREELKQKIRNKQIEEARQRKEIEEYHDQQLDRIINGTYLDDNNSENDDYYDDDYDDYDDYDEVDRHGRGRR